MSATQFIASGDAKETSPAIMRAIWDLAHPKTYQAAERIWGAPTVEELIAIWEVVTNNGLRDASDYVWGAAGSEWAP